MKSYKVSVTTTSKSVYELIGQEHKQCTEMLIQAPTANTDPLYFGEKTEEFFELYPTASAGLVEQNTKNLYIKGSVGDYVVIGLM